ncbi:PREDICTED: uncharacterized protein LOC105557975 [Vollenhovia emeryi]|uniref:uncharacterized protein LOC105557975 n=1 Tax=Vollenhovia emeryi TaxID=411798 RepID=UPI0005F54221|nr:PREDICTED: uncharacterized protein LOC105557975 [Vollenhovia emeryi]
MGSPISPIIANIFMEHFENEILKKAPLKPSTWFRYVDDTFVIWNHGRETLPQFLTFINSQHPNIQFTMETEQDSQIPFLDVMVRRNENGTLSHNVYRKPTHTDRYLHANSHHHPAQMNSVISSLVHRALSNSEPTALDGELNHLHRTLTMNGYSSRNINRAIKKLTNKESGQNNTTTPETERED